MMLLFTGFFDFFNIFGNGFTIRSLVATVVMCLKVPIYVGGLTSLRNRGGELVWGNQGFAPAGTSSWHVVGEADSSVGAHQYAWWWPDSGERQRARSPRPHAAGRVPGRRLPPRRRGRRSPPAPHHPGRLYVHRLDGWSSRTRSCTPTQHMYTVHTQRRPC